MRYACRGCSAAPAGIVDLQAVPGLCRSHRPHGIPLDRRPGQRLGLNRFLDSAQTDESGYVELGDLLSAEEEGPGGVTPDDGPPCGGTIVFRGHYGGNRTSSGTWSNGDAIAEATIDWEKYRPHLKEEIDAAGAAKDCTVFRSWPTKWPTHFGTRCCGTMCSDWVCRPDAGRTTDRHLK